MAHSSFSSFVRKSAATLSVVTVTLVAQNVALKVVGNTAKGQRAGGTGAILQIWASSGSQVGQANSSGSLVMSGNLIVAHNKTGSGKIFIMGTDGAGACYSDEDGTGCSCTYYNNGEQVTYQGSTADCSAETHR